MKWMVPFSVSLLIPALFFILLPGCSSEKLDPAIASYVDSLVTAQIKPGDPGAVVLVARDGAPIFRKAYGLANLELNVSAVPENVYAIASMTKQFTAIAMLQLVQQGKVSLQDDLRKYLPEYNTHGRLITIEQLLTHTNGIPNFSYRAELDTMEVIEPTREELMNIVANDSLLFEPGTDWSYNDFGFILAAFIIERVSGMAYHDYMQKNIFDPAGMKHTTFGTHERTIPLLASAYVYGVDTPFRPEEHYTWSWDLGMGDMLTTVDDMLLWDEALYANKLVSHELLEKASTSTLLTSGEKTNYGYGWWVAEDQGAKILMHGGGLGGWRSVSVRIPSQHLFVAVLSNNGSIQVPPLGMQIMLRVAGKTIGVPPVQRLPREQLHEYTGVYEMLHHRGLNVRDITAGELYRTIMVQDSVLVSRPSGMGKTPLLNVGKDLFLLQGTTTLFLFQRNGGGKITGIEWYGTPIIFGPVRKEPKTELVIPPEKTPVSLDAKLLKALAGRYTFGGDHTFRVRVDSLRVLMDGVGEIFPENEIRFFSKDQDVIVEFKKNATGVVMGLVLNQIWTHKGRKLD